MSSSRFVKEGENQYKHASRLIMAFDDLTKETYSTPPQGVFGSVAVVRCNGVTLSSNALDIEFSVPFDDNMEPNEAEIIIYNLTDTTIARLKKGQKIYITAGYKDDTGAIFEGFIDYSYTTYEGADKVTKIKAVDDNEKKTVESVAINANTAKDALAELLRMTGTEVVGGIRAVRNPSYENAQTVDGDLKAAIKKYADDCGISVYINKGKWYARSLFDGDNINFTICENTGMIGSPSPFEEEISTEGYTGIVTGYKISTLLQHRITTAAIVNLSSLTANGQFRVRSGRHIFNSSEAITEIEVIAPEKEVKA